MDVHKVRGLLALAIAKAGGNKAFGDANDISASYVSDVLRGNREPSHKILAALGLEKIVSYRRKAPTPERVEERG